MFSLDRNIIIKSRSEMFTKRYFIRNFHETFELLDLLAERKAHSDKT